MAEFDMRLFGEDYLRFWEGELSDERSDREADVAWRLLGLERGVEVLDLACGHGRLSNRLAERGARVRGWTRRRSSSSARGVTPRNGESTSSTSRATCASFRGRPGSTQCSTGSRRSATTTTTPLGPRRRPSHAPAGRTLRARDAQPAGADETLRVFGITEGDGDFLLELRGFDVVGSRSETEYVAVRSGAIRRYRTSIRLFGFAELRDWLLAAGFARVEPFGSDGEPLTVEHHRMVAVATR